MPIAVMKVSFVYKYYFSFPFSMREKVGGLDEFDVVIRETYEKCSSASFVGRSLNRYTA